MSRFVRVASWTIAVLICLSWAIKASGRIDARTRRGFVCQFNKRILNPFAMSLVVRRSMYYGVLFERRPPRLHVVLATRHDPQLRLHRLRLAAELTEIRESDLRFTLDETRELLAGAGIQLSDRSLELLHERTEGWVAGLRLAAISLARHPAPERFVAEFAGSERMVSEYLLAEVLERQPAAVRRLLLRTSIVERVNGPLADVLVGSSGSERVLQELEAANAFVVSLDAGRSWFRYHHLFADLLRLELRRAEPDEVVGLHRLAAEWYSAHGHVIEAVRHAQTAEEWAYAAQLLVGTGLTLWLSGEEATLATLIAAFPADAPAGPDLALLLGHREMTLGSLDRAGSYLALAEHHASEAEVDRRRPFDVALAVTRLTLARKRGDFQRGARKSAGAARREGRGDAERTRAQQRGQCRGADEPWNRRAVGISTRNSALASGAGARAGAAGRPCLR
jgi:LuxR family maltose regulon positive regulatory protein